MRVIVMAMAGCILVSCFAGKGTFVFAKEEVKIDEFNYKSNEEAQKIWFPSPDGRSVPVSVSKDETGKRVLKLDLNFTSTQDRRCSWDRKIELDLSKYHTFMLKLKTDDPSAISQLAIYFESPGGWFVAVPALQNTKDWQKLKISKAAFKDEQTPAGWDQITRIRISFWKQPTPKDTVVLLGELAAFSGGDIGVVMGDLTVKAGSSEAGGVKRYYAEMAKFLENIGLEVVQINDTELEKGIEITKGIEVLIFPFNPDVSDIEVETVKKFIEDGGKIMVFYTPGKLTPLLGIKGTTFFRATPDKGEFTTVKFKTEMVEGIPSEVLQGSWNVQIPTIIEGKTKVIGEWLDAKGNPTGIPAATLSNNSFYFSHVLLNRESSGKQMILSLLAHFSPKIKSVISKLIFESSIKPSGFNSFEEFKKYIEEKKKTITKKKAKEVTMLIRQATKLINKAKDTGNLKEMFSLTESITSNLQKAFSKCFPSKKREFRGVWCHSAFGVSGWTWDEAIKNLKDNGFNAVVVNMLWGGLAYYPSDVLPVAEEVKTRGDQLALCVQACKKYGVECHVWKVNYWLKDAPKEFIEKLRSEGRLQIDKSGKETRYQGYSSPWLCPSHPDNLKLELNSILEIVKKYDVDGIHLDYIRYPDGSSCYCPGCRQRFESEKGIKVENWPQDVISGVQANEFMTWRASQITKLVKAVSEEAKKIKPSIKISAAVSRHYPDCIKSLGQDWKNWVENGYLDFICPMDYTDSNLTFENAVRGQVEEIIKGRIPLYPGIGATSSSSTLSPEQTAVQAQMTRDLGADGFIIFNYVKTVGTQHLPALHEGISSVPAVPPHRK